MEDGLLGPEDQVGTGQLYAELLYVLFEAGSDICNMQQLLQTIASATTGGALFGESEKLKLAEAHGCMQDGGKGDRMVQQDGPGIRAKSWCGVT